jgi:hypothetical protein
METHKTLHGWALLSAIIAFLIVFAPLGVIIARVWQTGPQ